MACSDFLLEKMPILWAASYAPYIKLCYNSLDY